MEEKFMTAAEAAKVFGEKNRWVSGNIVGGSLPSGDYKLGAIVPKDYAITNADGSINKGMYPLVRVEGHGEISGGQIIVSGAMPVAVEMDEEGNEKPVNPENYVVVNNDGKTYRINTAPVNPQFTGTPINALIELQGKTVRLTATTIKVPTEFPKGNARTKAKMTEIAKKLGSKTVYRVQLV